MKTIWIVLCGIGAAAGYVALSFALSAGGGFSLAVILGTVVALALAGVRRSAESMSGAEEEKARVGCRGGDEGEKVGGGGQRNVASDSAGQPTDDGARTPAAPVGTQSTGNADSLGNDSGAPGGRPLPQQNESDAQRHVPCPPPPLLSTSSQPSSTFSPAALWEQARVMVHSAIPDFEEDAEYLDLVFSAAEQGHVPALAKLGEYAFRRGAFVEAYFWTMIAKCRLELSGDADEQGVKEIDGMLFAIRREWTAVGQPPEFENVYENFPVERGELGRVFLQLDSGIQANQARGFIRELAKKGNPDAALFVLSAGE